MHFGWLSAVGMPLRVLTGSLLHDHTFWSLVAVILKVAIIVCSVSALGVAAASHLREVAELHEAVAISRLRTSVLVSAFQWLLSDGIWRLAQLFVPNASTLQMLV